MSTNPRTFTHTYRPAHVSKGQYSCQRRFGEPRPKWPDLFPLSQTNKPRSHDDGHGRVSVYRDAEYDEAEVTIKIGITTFAEVTAALGADKLRELARALLDAAHDIETNPARTLLANDTSKAAA